MKVTHFEVVGKDMIRFSGRQRHSKFFGFSPRDLTQLLGDPLPCELSGHVVLASYDQGFFPTPMWAVEVSIAALDPQDPDAGGDTCLVVIDWNRTPLSDTSGYFRVTFPDWLSFEHEQALDAWLLAEMNQVKAPTLKTAA